MNDIAKLSTTELLKELEKRKKEVLPSKKKKSKEEVEPEWVGKFAHELPDESSRKKFAQYSTPSHIAEFCSRLLTDCGELDLKDQIVYEPFVGAGAMFLPLRNKGAVLIGSDIDLEALEICKKLVPEAILIHHNSLSCLKPKQNIEHFEKKIEELRNKPKSNAKNDAKIVRLEERIEEEKKRTPWRWDYYCVEHLYHEPRETFLNLTRILRNREIKAMREKHNGGKEMYFTCSYCEEKEVDYQIGEDEVGNVICRNCYQKIN